MQITTNQTVYYTMNGKCCARGMKTDRRKRVYCTFGTATQYENFPISDLRRMITI